MDYFEYQGNQLFCEKVKVSDLAQEYGTPLYVYSRRTLVEHYRKLADAFKDLSPLVCYSVKASSTIALCRALAQEGAGFDVVSGGEIFRALQAGVKGDRVVFAGVGKTRQEMVEALEADILQFNVESPGELELLDEAAHELRRKARVALRVNPDVVADTHDYLATGKHGTKFGMTLETAAECLKTAGRFSSVEVVGLHVHVGSQITDTAAHVKAVERTSEFLSDAWPPNLPFRTLDIGGGFGIFYKGGEARSAEEFGRALSPLIRRLSCRLILEPGRFIVGNAGILVTRVLYRKESAGQTFVVCDAGMNDLIRPSLYGAFHRIWPVTTAPGGEGAGGRIRADIVGPVCESGDFFARDREIPSVAPGECLAIFSAGAYGMAMSSNYNSRPRAAEILVDGETATLVRKRETYKDLVRNEIY
ncbi:MAG: diaminopimelate decarboxylase [Planctomycetota bacterium]